MRVESSASGTLAGLCRGRAGVSSACKQRSHERRASGLAINNQPEDRMGSVMPVCKENVLLFPPSEESAPRGGPLRCRKRLGGLLKYYFREAA